MKHLMKNMMAAMIVVVMGMALVGCEWGGGGDDNSWNDSASIANFTGNYQANGGYLVSDYTTTTGGGSTGSTTVIDGGFIPPIQTVSASFSGNSISFTTDFVPIKPGSITVTFADGANGTVTDNGSGGLSGSYLNAFPGSHPANGSVVYENGQVSIFFPDILGLQSSSVKVRYTVNSTSGSTTTTSSSSSAPGSSSFSIYAFNVQQSGNKVKIIDNNGKVYEGNLGDVRTTGNLSSSSSGSGLVAGDQVTAPFSAAGRSKSGMYVNMAGSFQGTVAGVTSVSETSGATTTIKTSFALTSRVIQGTWIEDGGQTGNINGVCPASANVTFSSTTSTNAP